MILNKHCVYITNCDIMSIATVALAHDIIYSERRIIL